MKVLKPACLTSLGFCLIFALCSTAVHAEVTILFDGEQTPFDNSEGGAFGEWRNVSGNTGFDEGNGVDDYGIELVPAASNPFGTGNAMRMWDLASNEKPELQGEFGSFDMSDPPVFTNTPLTEPFRIDIDSNNRAPVDETNPDGNHAIRLRMANAGQSITSESRSAFSLSWQANGEFTAKYSGVADTNPNDVDTLNSDPLVGPQTITMIANGQTAGDYSYSLFGESRTLNPLHYDVYINGVLLNDSTDADFANGMQFHTERSFGNYFPDDGLGRIGMVGSSNSDTLPDYDFDNIVLRTGDDIEETASLLGDFDNDGDVDLDDLDQYNGNLGMAATGALESLDLNDDGTVGADDFMQHYETLVETSNGGKGTAAGDVNLDGVVNVLGDAFSLVGNLNNAATSWSQGDLNADGTVNVLGDAFLLVGNIGADNGGGGSAPTSSSVPEPNSLMLLLLSGVGVAIRRRK